MFYLFAVVALVAAKTTTKDQCITNPKIAPFVTKWEKAWETGSPAEVSKLVTPDILQYGPTNGLPCNTREKVKDYATKMMKKKDIKNVESVLLVPREKGFAWVWETISKKGDKVLGMDIAEMNPEFSEISKLYTFQYPRDPREKPLKSMGAMKECPNPKAREIATKLHKDFEGDDTSKIIKYFSPNAVAVGPEYKHVGKAEIFEGMSDMLKYVELEKVDEVMFIPLEKGFISAINATFKSKSNPDKELTTLIGEVVGMDKSGKITSYWVFPSMLSDPRRELANKLMKAWEKRDVDVIMKSFADDATIETKEGIKNGKAAIKQYLQKMMAKYNPVSTEEKNFIPVDNGFILEWMSTVIKAKDAKKGKKKEKKMKGVDIVTLNENDLISSVSGYWNKVEGEECPCKATNQCNCINCKCTKDLEISCPCAFEYDDDDNDDDIDNDNDDDNNKADKPQK